jgi:hypothetical protein
VAFPIVILENYLIPSARIFIAKNAKTLKELGYKKFLFEMNSELSPKDLIKQLTFLCTNTKLKQSPVYDSSVSLLNMLNALEYNKIEYEFIDPETQKEALQQISDLKKESALNNGNNNALNHREATTKQRDVIMSSIIIKQAKQYNGGVFFLGGYNHNNLVHLLESNQSNYYRYAILSNSEENNKAKEMIHPNDFAMWSGFEHADNRLDYYKTDICYFDMKNPISFELIESICHLTKQNPCEKPHIDRYLSEELGHSYDFTSDEFYVVNATLSMESQQKAKEQANLIKKTFPKLTFFMKNEGEKCSLIIPGTNLSEQRDNIIQKQ